MREPMLNMRIFGFLKAPLILVFGGFFAISNFILNWIKIESINSGELAHIFGFLIGILLIGIMYRESIYVFYNWIFIGAGFWLIMASISNFINYNLNLSNIIIQLFFILTGSFLIINSYLKLKIQIKYG